jgi:hypothetical protein
MGLLVQLVLELSVFNLGHDTAGVQTWSCVSGDVVSDRRHEGILTRAVDAGVDGDHCDEMRVSQEPEGR